MMNAKILINEKNLQKKKKEKSTVSVIGQYPDDNNGDILIASLIRVLIEGNSDVRKVILNRPEKLNSLTYEMISQLTRTLRAYEIDPAVKLVILKGKGNAFCAGGDVVKAVHFILAGHWSFAASFYKKQLILDYLLATYKKPLVALINGIVMGGGAGLTMHGRFRIVTENTVFAMPEASLGLFADVGASCFLSKLPGFFGEYLGLTGARLDGSEMLACGLATHFIASKDLLLLENALSELGCADTATIDDLVNRFKGQPPLKHQSTFRRLDTINGCFSGRTVEEILISLENEAAKGAEKWIDKAKISMKSASPTGLKITLRSIREGRMQNLEQCLSREYTIFRHIVRRTVSSDLFEGARALFFNKDKKPKWEPSKLELVTEEMLDRCFTEVDGDDDWDKLQFPDRSDFTGMAKAKL
ncbi:hypothetical protein Nepgr_001354 [Nepenthes gracilis]|uniref:3-hydroxyisobutyryl-CoA hydrolase n=1 Tax=Nepenthes gracilis TaxID=150966 RepID=A0AAD3P5W2_NEPGR|nr:hypothetical protein Nepgr_001354 [Nepenthes gracilis]